MPEIGKIKGVNDLVKRLKSLTKKSRREDDVTIIVGYTANYALFVHENIEMKLKGQKRRGKGKKGKYWDPQGKAQAKFLEEPARTMRKELVGIIKAVYERTGTLLKGLFTAGLRLQRESQKLVPVDIGNLKGSAFTRKE